MVTAVRNLFPDAEVVPSDDVVRGTARNLDRLREQIRNQKIRDAARRQLLAGRRGDRTVVSLSKEAAVVGVVNFSNASPLGDIRVEIESEDIAGVIDYVAESTIPPER